MYRPAKCGGPSNCRSGPCGATAIFEAAVTINAAAIGRNGAQTGAIGDALSCVSPAQCLSKVNSLPGLVW